MHMPASMSKEQVPSQDGHEAAAGQEGSESAGRASKSSGFVFLAGITGMSVIGGFGLTIGMAKKKDPNMFAKGMMAGQGLPESGGVLALRALGLGTLYAVGGFSIFCFTVCKLMGVRSMEDFRTKVQSKMPTVPKSEQQGRNDFKTAQELVDYIIYDGKS